MMQDSTQLACGPAEIVGCCTAVALAAASGPQGRALLAVLLHDQRRVGGQATAGEPGRQLAQQRRALAQRHCAVGRQARRRRQRGQVAPGVLRDRRAQQLRSHIKRAGKPFPAHGCVVRTLRCCHLPR